MKKKMDMDRSERSPATEQLSELLAQLRAGNSEARMQIIHHACGRFRVLASRMLREKFARVGRWEETDDVLQESLLKLHRALTEVQPESPAQLMGLAAMQIRRTLLDLARHHYGPHGSARHHHTDRKGPTSRRALVERQPSDEPESLEEWTLFHEAVEQLPDDEKQVFSLLWYDGTSRTEAARLLNVNERTVRRRWQLARCLLHSLMHGSKPE